MTTSYLGWVFCGVVAMLWMVAAPAGAVGVADDYKVPTLVIPYAWHKPTLDGTIREDEWRQALSINALQTTTHAVSARQTRFWLMWDEDFLYVAMRSPLRPGERVIQALRDRDKDVNVVFDDSYEIWLDAGTHSPDGQPVFFQYLSNFAGARYDVLQEPAAGNSRLGWTAHWDPHNRLTPDGRAWEMTLAIPRRSVYLDRPFFDGQPLTMLLTRNYKRPWEQNSVSGSGSFSVRETHARLVLSKQAPAVHLLAVADPAGQTFGLELAAWARQAETLHWQFTSDGGATQTGDLPVAAGQTASLAPRLDLDTAGPGNFRVTVWGTDRSRPLLDWSARRQWGDRTALTQPIHDTGDQVALTLAYNPARDYLRVTGDFIDYDARASIARYQASVRDSHGTTLAQKDLTLDSLAYVRGLLRLPNPAPGDYTAQLATFDAAGHPLFTRETAFTKKDPAQAFPWWNTKLGDIHKVLAPWTPVRYGAGRLDVWGRSLRLGPAGLPAQVTTQGQRLLAGASTLTATLGDGRTVAAQGTKLTTLSTADYRVVTRAASALGDISVTSRVTTEFDGMCKVEMTLTPKRSTPVRALTLTVPLANATADYLHACGEGIRYGFDYRFLPRDKMGRLWDSRSVDGQPMVVGSFIPYLWIGNPTGGLCWFADSDQGWVPNNAVPAIEVRRTSRLSTDLVLNLISSRTVLRGPHTITFAFQATPVKPMRPGWRMDTWWTGDSFKDWAQVESVGHAGDMGLIFDSIPFPLDPAASRRMVEERHRETNANIFGVAKYRANAVPYLEHINMGEPFVPELTYFNEEWRTQVSRGLSYGKTLQDFMVYHLSRWMGQTGMDGIYIDNVYPIADDTIDAGRGYRLPDGRVQPTYQMFDTRDYFLRLRAAFAAQGHSGKLVLHITNHLIAPWIGAADVALDGEHHVIFPEMGQDFMDFWSRERMRLDYPEQWGVAVNFLQEYQGPWDHARLVQVMRAYTGMQLLNDVLASANANSLNQAAWEARDRFGLEAADVRFHAYWDSARGFDTPTPNVSISGWTRPNGTALLAVVNTGEATTAAVTVDAARLGLSDPAHWHVTDAETGAPLAADAHGRIRVPVGRHDYRQVLITAK